MIVTSNGRDFPESALSPYGIEAKHPDEFLVDQMGLAPGAVVRIILEQSQALKNPPRTVPDVLGALQDCGLGQSVAKLRELLAEYPSF